MENENFFSKRESKTMDNHNENKDDKKEAIKELIRFAELRVKDLQNAIHLVNRYSLLYAVTAFALIGFFLQQKNFPKDFHVSVIIFAIIGLAFFVIIIAAKNFNVNEKFIEEIIKKNLSGVATHEKILNAYVKEIEKLRKVRMRKIVCAIAYVLYFALFVIYVYSEVF